MNQELEESLVSIAAPIFDPAGRCSRACCRRC
ncbi:MAG: hypothetical protein Q8O29_19775 [Polaromonas sp.]|nr:hypothetical protein [Polaromonas sp.]MDP2820473.1 hypothetical protein [Polaromonas sp.]